jgi:hypothetical protein
MAAMRPDGTAIETPIGRGRPRGRALSDAGATRIRDLILSLLRDGVELSIPDTLAVLAKLRLSRSQVYGRLERGPRLPRREVLERLLREAPGAGGGDAA